MVLFELLQLARVFLYYLRIEYLWHALIMPLTNRNGIMFSSSCFAGGLPRTASLIACQLRQNRRDVISPSRGLEHRPAMLLVSYYSGPKPFSQRAR
jgi:hypothetical protein